MIKNTLFAFYSPVFSLTFLLFSSPASSQQVTGTWKGKINRQKVEVKLIQNGDSLTGTSYYYTSADNFRRYSIKGYFDSHTNETVWWDDQLLEEHSGKFSLYLPGRVPFLSRADFNCPGGGKMMLDGKSSEPEKEKNQKGEVHLEKSATSSFPDEWDWVIENYTAGTNNPEIIDSISLIAGKTTMSATPPDPATVEKPVLVKTKEQKNTNKPVIQPQHPLKKNSELERDKPFLITPLAIEEKFITRQKVFVKEIPVSGDTLELRFYDNAEIDGDSISLFLNGALILEHQRLTAAAFVLKLPVSALKETNELVMVAENLGSIPPNTSYMVAIINDKRYDALLASSEGSSAMIRLVKTP